MDPISWMKVPLGDNSPCSTLGEMADFVAPWVLFGEAVFLIGL